MLWLAWGYGRGVARRLYRSSPLSPAKLGLLIGVGYARLMLLGLNTWWIDAVMTRFLEFHLTTKSLAIGYVRSDLAEDGAEVALDILGERRRAFVRCDALYDPQNERLRS